MMTPTIHMNGTSKEVLIEQLCEAIYTIHQAGEKLAAACPNGRDYYPQSNGAINIAMNEHEARMKKLREVVDELQQIAEYIS